MIPFNKPSVVGNELTYIADAVNRGRISGNGFYTHKGEAWLSDYYNSTAFLTSSCTHALEICAILLKKQTKKREVIIPSFAYVSTANAFYLHGFTIKFCDVDPSNGNLSITSLQKMITTETAAVVALHYAGNCCDIESLIPFCKSKNIFLVEDNALGIGASYKGEKLGTFGDLSTLSFHQTKNVSAGEGGALLVNNPIFENDVHIIRNKGTNRKDFEDGKAAIYEWIGEGSAYLCSELNAAYLWGQLEFFETIIVRRIELWNNYFRALNSIADCQTQEENCLINGSIFYLKCQSEIERQNLIKKLKADDILAVFHYQPLHASAFYTKDNKAMELPNSTSFANHIVRLPLYFALTEKEQNHIINSVRDFYSK